MKAAIPLLIAGMFLLALPACKKDWECVCTDPAGYENTATLSRLGERDAQVACELLATDDLTCTLK